MITRRNFFGTVAALVVGGGAAQLRLTATAAPVVTSEPMGLAALVRSLPKGTVIAGVTYASFDFHRAPRRDDGDTILELR